MTGNTRSKYQQIIAERGEWLIRNFLDVGGRAESERREYFSCLAALRR